MSDQLLENSDAQRDTERLSRFRDWVLLIIVVVVLGFGIGLFRWWWLEVDVVDLAVEATFVLAIFVIGICRVVLPELRSAIDRGVAYYFIFTAIVVALIAPASFYFLAAKFVVTQLGVIWCIIFFLFSLALWLACWAVLAVKRWRISLFDVLAVMGWFVPMIFVFNYIVISIVMFGTGSFFVLEQSNVEAPIGSGVSLDDYLNVFVWHVLEAIPTLNVNDTIRWPEPILDQRPPLLGWLVLLFKISVVASGVGTFVTYWKSQRTLADA